MQLRDVTTQLAAYGTWKQWALAILAGVVSWILLACVYVGLVIALAA